MAKRNRGASQPKNLSKDEIPKVTPVIHSLGRSDLPKIKQDYEQNGIVVIQVLTDEECKTLIASQVKEVLLKQPWKVLLKLKDPLDPTRYLDIDTDRDAYIAELTKPNLSKRELDFLFHVWTLHQGFGASCCPGSIHTKELWTLRQNESIYNVAAEILGDKELWVDINRSIQKLPTMGEKEFIHVDLPFICMKWSKPTALSGKVAYTPCEFICVPGTHTEEEHARIVEAYSPIYPGAKATDAKFGLDPKKPDPLNLRGRRAAIQIPAGCIALWSPMLWHGTTKNPRNGSVQFGAYLGYMSAEDRPQYARRAKISELEDRIRSFEMGLAPKLWPSLDSIYYYPKRYLNFPDFLKPYTDKARPDWEGRAKRTIKTGKHAGEVIDDLLPVRKDWSPPSLTPLGERLLGRVSWK